MNKIARCQIDYLEYQMNNVYNYSTCKKFIKKRKY